MLLSPDACATDAGCAQFPVRSAATGTSGDAVNHSACSDTRIQLHHLHRSMLNNNDPDEHNGTALQAATKHPVASEKLSCTHAESSQDSTLDGSSSATSSTPCRPSQHMPSSDGAINANSHSCNTGTAREGEECFKSSNVHFRLYRGSCVHVSGSYIKDLSRLGRQLSRTVIVDNSPASYMWNPDSAIPSVSYIDDKEDDGLLKILEVLMLLKESPDIRLDLPGARAAVGYHVPVC
jgi:hypothetical protein